MEIKVQGDVVTSSYISGLSYLKTDMAAPIMVAFDVTNACNFRCVHCFNHSGEDIYHNELSDEDKLKVADQIIDLNPYLVCLCGGETTCCRVLIKIIEKLSGNIPTINIVSNGYLIDENFAFRLKNAGVSAVQISLDGITPEQHDTFRGRLGAFEHATNAMRILNKLGISVLSSLVPNKLNYLDTYKYFELCHNLGVRYARCMPYLPMGRGNSVGNSLILNAEQYYVFIQQLLEAKEKFTDMVIEWGDPIDHTYRLPANAKLGLDSYSMDIKSNGDIGVSAYFPIVVGNCLKHTLKDYWNAGYKYIWKDPIINRMMDEIETITDFKKFEHMKPYTIDIIDDRRVL